MKKYILIAVIALSLAIFPWIAAYASESNENHEMMKKNNKKEFERIEDGIIFKITSDSPEPVMRIKEKTSGHKDMACKQGKRKHHPQGEKNHLL